MVKNILKVEIAEKPYQLEHGLMFRKYLDENNGMLFKFKNPENLKFWGLNTYIPLSVAFIDENNQIVKIGYIDTCSTKVIDSEKACNLAIEANLDFFDKNKIKVGDKIEIIADKNDFSYVQFKESIIL